MRGLVIAMSIVVGAAAGCVKPEADSKRTASTSQKKTSSRVRGKSIGAKSTRSTKTNQPHRLPSRKVRAASQATMAVVKQVAGAVTLHAMSEGKPPKALRALVDKELIEPAQLKDAWGQPLVLRILRRKGESHKVCSSGPDRRMATEDDICASD